MAEQYESTSGSAAWLERLQEVKLQIQKLTDEKEDLEQALAKDILATGTNTARMRNGWRATVIVGRRYGVVPQLQASDPILFASLCETKVSSALVRKAIDEGHLSLDDDRVVVKENRASIRFTQAEGNANE